VINVLQAVILTKEEQMVLTPTYYVFKMYKVHQDAVSIPIVLNAEDLDVDGEKIKMINASASIKDGYINISICNLSASKSTKLACNFEGAIGKSATAEIITSSNMTDFNDFGKAEKLNIKEFKGFELNKNSLKVDMPSKSVVMIRVKL